MPESVLAEAERLVYGDRGDAYGEPYDDFSRTAKFWSPVLGVDVTPEQVGLCMLLVKVSRQVNEPKRDNMVDAAGYADTVQQVIERRRQLDLEYDGSDVVESIKEPLRAAMLQSIHDTVGAPHPGEAPLADWERDLLEPPIVDGDGDHWSHVGDGLYTYRSKWSGVLATSPQYSRQTRRYIKDKYGIEGED